MAKKKSLPESNLEVNFESLLKEFNALWEKSPKDLTKFAALKQKAKSTTLTFRQREAITDRCDNVINGRYGKTKLGIQFYPTSENGKESK